MIHYRNNLLDTYEIICTEFHKCLGDRIPARISGVNFSENSFNRIDRHFTSSSSPAPRPSLLYSKHGHGSSGCFYECFIQVVGADGNQLRVAVKVVSCQERSKTFPLPCISRQFNFDLFLGPIVKVSRTDRNGV
jgi:hypothetical protein